MANENQNNKENMTKEEAVAILALDGLMLTLKSAVITDERERLVTEARSKALLIACQALDREIKKEKGDTDTNGIEIEFGD